MLVGTKTIVAINYVCRNKHMFDKTFVMTDIVASNIIFSRQNTTTRLSRQNTTTHAKTFVAAKLCLLRQIFVATNVLSRRTHVCRDKHYKHIFVATKDVLCRNKQSYLCQLPPMILSYHSGLRGRGGRGGKGGGVNVYMFVRHCFYYFMCIYNFSFIG